VVNIVTGFGETAGAALAEHPEVDKVAFTGSTEVGKLIVKAAAGNLKPVSLELGGKSPAIVFPDADLDRAVSGTAEAIFYNQGQCCTAGSRLFAHKSAYDKVVEGIIGRVGKIKVGHGLDPSVELGPLVSKEQHTRVAGYIESGGKQGATVATGGHVIGNQGYFVEPTVLLKTDRSMRVVREEIFGPVVCVQSFDDEDLDAVAKFANDTEYGLQASVWTRKLKVAHTMAKKDQGWHHLRQQPQLRRSCLAFRWLQTIGLGPRDGKGSHGELHGDELRRRESGLIQTSSKNARRADPPKRRCYICVAAPLSTRFVCYRRSFEKICGYALPRSRTLHWRPVEEGTGPARAQPC
jgi:Aldehyde dehydrogenase family